MKELKRYLIAFCFSSGFVFLIFQNCAGSNSFQLASNILASETSVYPLPFSHPSVEISSQEILESGAMVIGDRIYLESVFRDVFEAPGASAGIVGFVEAVLNQEFGPSQNMLGRACSLNEGGDFNSCGGNFPNLDVPMGGSSSTIREGARVQVCRRILGNDVVLSFAIGTVRGLQSTPDPESIEKTHHLFYPARAADTNFTKSVVELDNQMALQNETVLDRWRNIFLILCESPDWQTL